MGKLFDDFSLLQKTAERVRFISDSSDLIVVTNDNYYFLCKCQLETIGIFNVHSILEPFSRNTVPATSLAAKYVCEYVYPDSILLVLPSDYYLEDHVFLKT